MAAQRHRLSDVEVLEMSIVDKGANKRRWLMQKRQGGDTDPPGDEDVKLTVDMITKAVQDAMKAAPAPNDQPEVVTKAAFDEVVKGAAAAASKLEEIAKSVTDLKATVDKQGETITAQAAEIKKGAEALGATEKTIGDLRETVNKQAEIIAKARLLKGGNAEDDDPAPTRRQAPTKGSEKISWPKDLNEERRRV
jgi:hypothetical protein